MYAGFDQELAMAVGDEFDADNVHAYQLADFADTCGLPRTLVAKRLSHLIRKLSAAILELTFSDRIVTNKEQAAYLEIYKKTIIQRCEDLSEQTKGIVSIEL